MNVRWISFIVVLSLLIAGCAGSPFVTQPATSPQPPSATRDLPVSATATRSLPLAPTARGPVTLVVWLPPQFDPASGTPAALLLQRRLNEFGKQQPGVRIEIRVKAEEGTGGMLDSLFTANAAAPLAVPDLIALPYPLLELAALKGLLQTYDGLSTVLENPDWYDNARQMATLQERTYGLPFAGDALALVYRPPIVPSPPLDWSAVLTSSVPLAFPAADPQALFTLTEYQSNGGQVRDEQGRPYLDYNVLVELLTFFQECSVAGVMPYSITQYQDYDQIWGAFTNADVDLAAIWSSQYLSQLPAEAALALLPPPDATPFTLSTGWVWALPASELPSQEMSVKLAEFMVDREFLAQWTPVAGYLPTRPSSLAGFSPPALQPVIESILLSAQVLPPVDIQASLGPPLEQATVQVLKQQSDAATAAQAALNALTAP